MLKAALVGALVAGFFALITLLFNYIKSKIILRLCLTDSNCTNTFNFKGNTYSTDKYLKIKTKEYKQLSKNQLLKLVEKYEESLDQKKLSSIECLDLDAMKSALHSKY